jgi:hypothetical protein
VETALMRYGIPRKADAFQPGMVVVLADAAASVRPMKYLIPVIDSRLPPIFTEKRRIARAKVELPGKAAPIPLIGKHSGNENFGLRHCRAVLTNTARSRVSPREKCATTRRTHRALGKRVFKTSPAFGQRIDVGRVDPFVAVTAKGIEPLLIGAYPEYVRFHTDSIHIKESVHNRRDVVDT